VIFETRLFVRRTLPLIARRRTAYGAKPPHPGGVRDGRQTADSVEKLEKLGALKIPPNSMRSVFSRLTPSELG
jgi:hypothetical protein